MSGETEALIIPTVDIAVVVYPTRDGDAHMAAVIKDGRATSFDCTHLHHSPDAAHRCARKVAARLAEWADAPERQVAPGVWELTREAPVRRSGSWISPAGPPTPTTVWLRWTYTDLEILA